MYAPESVHNGIHIFLCVEVWHVAGIQDIVDVFQHHFVHDLNVAAAEATKKCLSRALEGRLRKGTLKRHDGVSNRKGNEKNMSYKRPSQKGIDTCLRND